MNPIKAELLNHISNLQYNSIFKSIPFENCQEYNEKKTLLNEALKEFNTKQFAHLKFRFVHRGPRIKNEAWTRKCNAISFDVYLTIDYSFSTLKTSWEKRQLDELNAKINFIKFFVKHAPQINPIIHELYQIAVHHDNTLETATLVPVKNFQEDAWPYLRKDMFKGTVKVKLILIKE